LISIRNVVLKGKIEKRDYRKKSMRQPSNTLGGSFGSLKTEGFLPIQPIEKKVEMLLFDIQTVGFWV
jgi:hypothetical protein